MFHVVRFIFRDRIAGNSEVALKCLALYLSRREQNRFKTNVIVFLLSTTLLHVLNLLLWKFSINDKKSGS